MLRLCGYVLGHMCKCLVRLCHSNWIKDAFVVLRILTGNRCNDRLRSGGLCGYRREDIDSIDSAK